MGVISNKKCQNKQNIFEIKIFINSGMLNQVNQGLLNIEIMSLGDVYLAKN
jgi:hypothetical protein